MDAANFLLRVRAELGSLYDVATEPEIRAGLMQVLDMIDERVDEDEAHAPEPTPMREPSVDLAEMARSVTMGRYFAHAGMAVVDPYADDGPRGLWGSMFGPLPDGTPKPVVEIPSTVIPSQHKVHA